MLGGAQLTQSDLVPTAVDPWKGEPAPDIDVIASAEIRLRHTDGAMSHSLWFCNAPEQGRYGWTEFAFTGLLELSPERPFALPPGPEAAQAFGDSLAYAITERWPGVERAVDDYVERWTALFAARSAIANVRE